MKLIAIDMDGTLLSNHKEITSENKKAIQEAKDAGHVVMICSGRPHDSLLTYLASEGLDLPVSGANGSVTWVDGKVIHSVSISKENGRTLYDWLTREGYPFKIYTSEGAYCPPNFLELVTKAFEEADYQAEGDHEPPIEFFIEFQKNQELLDLPDFSVLESNPQLDIYKVFVMTPDMGLKGRLQDWLASLDDIAFTSSYSTNVEIMSTEGHKGTGITQMAHYFGIPMSETYAIGDNFNDVGMLKTAGTSIAMENGEPEVKAMCDYVTKSNDEDGVAYAIRNYIL